MMSPMDKLLREDKLKSPKKKKPQFTQPKSGVPTFNPEVRRKEFRRYLDKSGLMNSLTRVLVKLYEEKERPDDVIEFIYDNLSGGMPIKMELDNLLAEKEELMNRVSDFEKENLRLKKKLDASHEEVERGGESEDNLVLVPDDEDSAVAPPALLSEEERSEGPGEAAEEADGEEEEDDGE